MPIIYLLLACFSITVFENIFLYIFSFLLTIVFILILWVFKKIRVLRNLIYAFIIFFFIFLSFQIKFNKYFKHDYLADFVYSWVIIDKVSQDVYLFENPLKDKFLYHSSTNYEVGQKIMVNAFFTGRQSKSLPPLDFDIWNFYSKYLMMKWYRWVLYERNSLTLGFSKLTFIQSVKKYYKDRVVWLYGQNKIAWLILGMSIWDKSLIPPNAYQDFIDSSVVHIVAVSGWNLVILIIFLNLILFFLPYYVRIFFILCTVVGYAVLCGMDTSVVRAVIMCWLVIVALFFGKKISLRRSIIYTVFAMLIFNPYYLIYDLGFLLSFAAIIWINIFQRFRRFGHGRVNSYIMPIIWAQIWVLPVLILYIGKISLLWFAANFIILPFTGILMLYWPLSILAFYFTGLWNLVYFWNLFMSRVYLLAHFFSSFNIYITFQYFWLKIYIFIVLTSFLIRLYFYYPQKGIVD